MSVIAIYAGNVSNRNRCDTHEHDKSSLIDLFMHIIILKISLKIKVWLYPVNIVLHHQITFSYPYLRVYYYELAWSASPQKESPPMVLLILKMILFQL